MYDNKHCPVCKSIMMAAVHCRLHKALVCIEHCTKCRHLQKPYWQCRYKVGTKGGELDGEKENRP